MAPKVLAPRARFNRACIMYCTHSRLMPVPCILGKPQDIVIAAWRIQKAAGPILSLNSGLTFVTSSFEIAASSALGVHSRTTVGKQTRLWY